MALGLILRCESEPAMTAAERAVEVVRRIQGRHFTPAGIDWLGMTEEVEKGFVALADELGQQLPKQEGSAALVQGACVRIMLKRIESLKSYGLTPERKSRLEVYEAIVEEMRAIRPEEL